MQALVVEGIAAIRVLGSDPCAYVIDYGCGTGNLALQLAHRGQKVAAVDISQRMVEITSQRAEQAGVGHLVTARQLQGNAGEVLQQMGPFDGAVVCNVLHYTPNEHELILALLHGHLKPGGRLFIIEILDTEATRQARAAKLKQRQDALTEQGQQQVAQNLNHFCYADPDALVAIARKLGVKVVGRRDFSVRDAFGAGMHIDMYALALIREVV